jgi:hypothetical protein
VNRLEKKAGAPSDNGNAHGADFQKENSTAREPEVNPDLTEIGESPGVTEGAPPSSSAEADSFGIYYVLDGKTWRVRNNSGEWIPTGVEAVRRELWIEKGYSIKIEEGKASEVEQVLHLLEMNCYVDFVGQYAGYLSAGRQDLRSGDRLLIPRNRELPPVKKGRWNATGLFIRGLIPDKTQRAVFYGWFKNAVETLRSDKPGEWRHGQALILLGDSGVGKTALQLEVITPALAGKDVDPTDYLVGDSSFNGELGEAEHWRISDPAWSDSKQKQFFAKKFKNAVADTCLRIHPKHRQAINLSVFKRLTLSINDDEESLNVLPLMDKSYLDKMIILDCQPSRYAPNAENWKEWRKRIASEIPAFLYWLLNDLRVPREIFDERYGVRYANEALNLRLAAPTREERESLKDEVLCKALLPGDRVFFRGNTSDIHAKLFGKDRILGKDVEIKVEAEASGLPRSLAHLGRMFNAFAGTGGGYRNGYRVLREKSQSQGKTVYEFFKLDERGKVMKTEGVKE